MYNVAIRESMYQLIDLVTHYGNPDSETYNILGLDFTKTVMEYFNNGKSLEPTEYSDYVVIVLRIMGLWPSYEIHSMITTLDHSMPEKAFEILQLWKDAYGDSIHDDERWIIDQWDNIHKYRNELHVIKQLST